MEFRTIVDVTSPSWSIAPCERMLFVGSCFADNMGQRFLQERFRAVVNPFGVMYNPISILHTVRRLIQSGEMPFRKDEPGTCVFTLGTNHVYVLKETGEVVDNCLKRPQNLFREQQLSVDECADALKEAIRLILSHFPHLRFILTVSPIRYRKYGYHGSQLSKAILLLAIQRVLDTGLTTNDNIMYFPAYEIMLDELRDYRFYKPDMLHPSEQAVDYLFERLDEAYFSDDTRTFLKAWRPIRKALAHKPFHPDSAEYAAFKQHVNEAVKALKEKYPVMDLP